MDETDNYDREVVASISEFQLADNDQIERAIEIHDGPVGEYRTTTIGDVKNALNWLQRSVEAVWNAWIDNIKSDLYHVIDETNSAMIISTGEYDVIRNSLRNSYPKDNKRISHIVSELHDELAQERTDRDFGYYYHIVIEKTEKASLDEITD